MISPTRTIKVNNCIVHLVGSVHSSAASVEVVKSIVPDQILLESDRQTLALIKNGAFQGSTADVPALVSFAKSHSIPVHAIDMSSDSMISRVFDGLSDRHRKELWKWSILNRFYRPLALCIFSYLPLRATWIDRFINRWGMSRALMDKVHDLVKEGHDSKALQEYMDSTFKFSTYLVNKEYDPQAYIELCLETSIDSRMEHSIIQLRDEYMCDKIKTLSQSMPEGAVCAAVVGHNHIPGMTRLLSSSEKIERVGSSPGSVSGKPPEPPARFMDRLLFHLLVCP